ncbi:hypothetical protein EF808_03805 [archaeon]|nr:MAG: hypothetical protein EF808_03805 [archaeon]
MISGATTACRPGTLTYPRPVGTSDVFSEFAEEARLYARVRDDLATSARGLDGAWRRDVESALYRMMRLERSTLGALAAARDQNFDRQDVTQALASMYPEGRRVSTLMMGTRDVSGLLQSLLHTLRKERSELFELSCTLYEKEAALSGNPLSPSMYRRILAGTLAEARYGTASFRFTTPPTGGIPATRTPAPMYPDNPFATDDEDIDGDGIIDREEQAHGTNPCKGDSDGDGITDADEIALGYDPLSSDSDGDETGDLADFAPLDPSRGGGGVDFNDDEEVLMLVYGSIAVTAAIGAMFGCSSCVGIAIKATKEFVVVYQEEMREQERGTDE